MPGLLGTNPIYTVLPAIKIPYFDFIRVKKSHHIGGSQSSPTTGNPQSEGKLTVVHDLSASVVILMRTAGSNTLYSEIN